MKSLRRFAVRLVFIVALAAAMLAVISPAHAGSVQARLEREQATAAASKAPPGHGEKIPYALVALGIILGLLVVTRSAGRDKKAKAAAEEA